MCGTGGDRAQDLGWRLQHGLLPEALHPPVFVVMIGTNDLGSGEQWEVVLAPSVPQVRHLPSPLLPLLHTGEQWEVAAAEVQLVLEQLHAARPQARSVYIDIYI